MFTEGRRDKIVNIVNDRQSISVKDLTEILGFSSATIRTDLNYLDNKKLIKRTHGGATAITSKDSNSTEDNAFEINFSSRSRQMTQEKKELAQKAFQFIKNNTCIILDASSTTFELAKLINTSDIRLMVITNGINTANLLKNNINVKTVLVGGVIQGSSNAIEGILGAEIFEKVHIDAVFLSGNAFDISKGIYDFNLQEIDLKKKMVEFSSHIYALVDYSKINKRSTAKFITTEKIDTLITNNDKLDSDILLQLKKLDLLHE